jgi:hypothetical protein
LNRYINYSTSFENAGTAREIELEKKLITTEYQLYQEDHTRMLKHLPVKSILASNYLCKAEPFVSSLISPEKFKDILSVAKYFPGNLTSFLGFEIHLGDDQQRADWAFAVSGAGDDRIVFENVLKQGTFPKLSIQRPEWQQIAAFSEAWTQKDSSLKKKVKCFWLEFDMPETKSDVSVPSVFFGPEKISLDASQDLMTQYAWLVNDALPLLRGRPLSTGVKRQILNCIEKIPQGASLFQVGTMLSRSTNDVRLYINKIHPRKIIPYLNALGWSDEQNKFQTLIKDVDSRADRFVLSFDVTNDGVGPRIGLECSFEENRYHEENRWQDLFEYLVKKGICLPQKRDALLQYPGVEHPDDFSGGVMKPFVSISQHLEDIFSGSLVRYISHVKVVYRPGRLLEAKAYPAVRLFEPSDTLLYE